MLCLFRIHDANVRIFLDEGSTTIAIDEKRHNTALVLSNAALVLSNAVAVLINADAVLTLPRTSLPFTQYLKTFYPVLP